jgi:hypothetical protein
MAVMVAIPKPTPVTIGCVTGLVAPPAMNTDEVMVAMDWSLLPRVTVTPFGGAAGDIFMLNGADWPGATFTFAGRLRFPAAATFKTTLVKPEFGAFPVAEIVAEPAGPAATGTLTVVALAAKLTVGCTLTAAVFEELKLTLNPLVGAGADNVSVRFCMAPAPIDSGPAGKLSAAPTCT